MSSHVSTSRDHFYPFIKPTLVSLSIGICLSCDLTQNPSKKDDGAKAPEISSCFEEGTEGIYYSASAGFTDNDRSSLFYLKNEDSAPVEVKGDNDPGLKIWKTNDIFFLTQLGNYATGVAAGDENGKISKFVETEAFTTFDPSDVVALTCESLLILNRSQKTTKPLDLSSAAVTNLGLEVEVPFSGHSHETEDNHHVIITSQGLNDAFEPNGAQKLYHYTFEESDKSFSLVREIALKSTNPVIFSSEESFVYVGSFCSSYLTETAFTACESIVQKYNMETGELTDLIDLKTEVSLQVQDVERVTKGSVATSLIFQGKEATSENYSFAELNFTQTPTTNIIYNYPASQNNAFGLELSAYLYSEKTNLYIIAAVSEAGSSHLVFVNEDGSVSAEVETEELVREMVEL